MPSLVPVASLPRQHQLTEPYRCLSRDESATHLAIAICIVLFPKYGFGRHHKSPLELSFTYSGLCESDCESIKNNLTDGLVTQFLLEQSSNEVWKFANLKYYFAGANGKRAKEFQE